MEVDKQGREQVDSENEIEGSTCRERVSCEVYLIEVSSAHFNLSSSK